MPLKLYTQDELPKFKFTIKDEDGKVVDLSSPNITAQVCHIREEDAATNKFTAAPDIAATMVDKPTGRIDYGLPAGGIDTAGSYSAQLMLTSADGDQQTERFKFTVEDGLRPVP